MTFNDEIIQWGTKLIDGWYFQAIKCMVFEYNENNYKGIYIELDLFTSSSKVSVECIVKKEEDVE